MIQPQWSQNMSKNKGMRIISLFVGVLLCMALMQTAFAAWSIPNWNAFTGSGNATTEKIETWNTTTTEKTTKGSAPPSDLMNNSFPFSDITNDSFIPLDTIKGSLPSSNVMKDSIPTSYCLDGSKFYDPMNISTPLNGTNTSRIKWY